MMDVPNSPLEPGNQPAEDRDDELAELFARWKESILEGRPCTVEEICRSCPELLQRFQQLLPQMNAIEALFESSDEGDASLFLPPAGLHGFQALSFHKQGGIGVVLVGEELDLKRTVAVKYLKTQFNTEAQQRFVREAETTARLEHPGIVPVYRIGRDAAGKPFYAMRFIQGETLREAVDRLHDSSEVKQLDTTERNLEIRRLLRALVTVCQTMAYAHSRGVIHRDLKPDNIMLGPFGEVLVLDWGLARQIGAEPPLRETSSSLPDSLNSENGLQTLEGHVKGSPAFMSPEQAQGAWSRVGTTSDVYSLGSILYQLLTGQVPYSGDSASQIIDRVRQGAFSPPAQVSPSVPKPLAAICLKAMQLEPENRYADPRLMANDLECWLADEPISVYPDPWWQTARRWVKQHPAITASVACLLLFLLIGFVVVKELEYRKSSQLGAANAKLLQWISMTQMPIQIPGASEVEIRPPAEQIQALEELRAFYTSEAQAGDLQYMVALAGVDQTLAAVQARRGELEAAQKNLDDAEALWKQLLPHFPLRFEIQFGLLENQINGGALMAMQSKFAEAEDCLIDALVQHKVLTQRYPNEKPLQICRPRILYSLYIVCAQIGSREWRDGELREGLSHLASAFAYHQAFIKETGQTAESDITWPTFLRGYGDALSLTASNEWQSKELESALKHYLQALPVWQELAARLPIDANIAQELDQIRLRSGLICHEIVTQAKHDLGTAELTELVRQSLDAVNAVSFKVRIDADWIILQRRLQDDIASLTEAEKR